MGSQCKSPRGGGTSPENLLRYKEDGGSSFIVESDDEAVDALRRVGSLDRQGPEHLRATFHHRTHGMELRGIVLALHGLAAIARNGNQRQ
jgi:hypothetical protein